MSKSTIHGLGLYSYQTILRGDRIYKVKGRRVSRSYDTNYDEGPNWIGVKWHEWLDPEATNPIMYTNHACSPNAIISEGLLVVAIHQIIAGTEIVLDYSTTESDPFWHMQCLCRCQGCRKRIRAFQYLPPVLQNLYERKLRREFVRAAQRAGRS